MIHYRYISIMVLIICYIRQYIYQYHVNGLPLIKILV